MDQKLGGGKDLEVIHMHDCMLNKRFLYTKIQKPAWGGVGAYVGNSE